MTWSRKKIHPIQYIKVQYRERRGEWLSRLVFLLGPWMCLWIVEILNQNDVFQDLYPWQVLMNLIWYYILFLVCRLILGRNRRAAAVGTVLCGIIGLVNHYILRFRGRVLFPADLMGWRTAANVAPGFDYSKDHYMVEAAVIMVVYLFLVWTCPAQKKRARLPLWGSAALWVVMLGYTYAFFGTNMLPSMGIYTHQWVTQHNGFVLNFTTALRYGRMEKPEDYSREKVLELMAQYPPVEGDPETVRPVNIVAIMNESFADFTLFDRFAPNEDPSPFLHSMKENTVKGWMYSPVTGGGTASVEFEYLTGFSTLFQPPHTVAYQLHVKEGVPGLARLTGALGYETTAFHPYKASGWNRPMVYRYMDFDKQMYEEDVPEEALRVRDFVSDRADYAEAIKKTETEDSTFFFTVTMQNHSGYALGWNNLERTIELPREARTADATAQQYFDLVRESDRALEELLAYYEACEEPTMVVFFGDHQPPLKNEFYEYLQGKPLDQRTTEELLEQYMVPFFIWTNYDIEEQEDVILSPNYLGVLTAKLAGLPLTGFMSFLDQAYELLPVITPVGLVDAEGRCKTREELNEEEQALLHRYAILNYCGVTDLFEEAKPLYYLN